MYTPASLSLSSCVLSGIVAALLATGVFVFDSPLGRVAANQLAWHHPQTTAEPAFSNLTARASVDRSRKSDRLPVARADRVTNTTIIAKNAPDPFGQGANGIPAGPTVEIGDGKRVRKLAPAPLLGCEALASPISDPILSRLVGRCFV